MATSTPLRTGRGLDERHRGLVLASEALRQESLDRRRGGRVRQVHVQAYQTIETRSGRSERGLQIFKHA